MNTKQQLRNKIEAQRKALDPQKLKSASARIVENFQTLDKFRSARMVALYKAIHGEVDIELLFSICWKAGMRTCIPVFNDKTKAYEMAEVMKKTRYSIGHYGILEPINPVPLTMNEVDLIAVPGVAFDSKGNRLGRGGGYYDRLLDRFSGYSAAVAFDFQILESLPHEPHDIPVNGIITDTKLIKCAQRTLDKTLR